VQVSLGWLQDEVDEQREDMVQVHGPDEDVLRQEPPFRIGTFFQVAKLAELGPMQPWRRRSDSDRIKQKRNEYDDRYGGGSNHGSVNKQGQRGQDVPNPGLSSLAGGLRGGTRRLVIALD
jgi:hypothetical protein